ncbi:PREDICTED: arrestin domain-containing protein A-like isoform X2 [Amphimedon queenslandica]|uniref:Arrestin C-terminal-like domain-containing protein n=1 Tax=Amphimedon queenslandica TaxID=400682 RepID=A0A1X7VEU4_AMPQE|nr:PREDICTED: arrestin domain-containing protein A-like isoform X2 [Amphimedon queenslandica]|eukprot:XP_011410464.2 PREDICTED: arrestin domain-containing protein A-like isoform X2 [Amphimedon queenslandica]
MLQRIRTRNYPMEDAQIEIRLNQGEYVGGDIIFGTVFVKAMGQLQSRTLKLQIRGYEKSSHQYNYTIALEGQDQYQTKTGKRQWEKVFLGEEFKMVEYPSGFPRGAFSFSFQYQLPHGVPGVFNIKEADSMDGSIKYSIAAYFTNPQPKQRLYAEVPLIVYDSLDCRNAHYPPSKLHSSDRVQYLVCLNRGSVHLSTKLDKSAYLSDEDISINVDVDNQSSLDVSSVTFTFNRVLRFFGKDGERGESELSDRVNFTPLVTQHHEAIPRGTKTSWTEIIKLKEVNKLPPNTSGSIVRCKYHIDIKLHCQYSLDIDQVQQVIIKPHHNSSWVMWEQPDWLDDCTVVTVRAPLTVTRDLLSSSSFANVLSPRQGTLSRQLN